MKITRVKFKNIGPYGDKFQEIKFHDNKFYQLVGRNGVGKTTFQDIIKYGLYGKIDNGNVGDLPNENNPKGYIEIEYELGIDTYINIWKFNPNKVAVYKKGSDKPEDTGGLESTRNWLERKFGIPFTVFANTLSISIKDFKSFVKMTASDTRNIRDKIFGFDVINDMAQVIKNTIQTLNSEERLLVDKISNTEDNIHSIKEQMQNNDVDQREVINNKIGIVNAELGVINTEIKKTEAKIQKLYSEHKDAQAGVDYLKYLAVKGRFDKLVIKSDGLEAELDGIVRKLETDKKLIDTYRSELEIIDHNAKAEKAADDLRQADIYRKQLVTINSDISGINTTIGNLEQSIDHTRQAIENNNAVESAKKAAKTYYDYKQRHGELVGRIHDYNDDLSSKEFELNELNGRLENTKIKKKTSHVHLETHRSGKCDKCGSEFDSGSDRLKQLEKEYKALCSDVEQLTSTIRDKQVAIDDIEHEIKNLNRESYELSDAMRTPKAIVSQLIGSDDLVDMDLEQVIGFLDGLTKNHKNLDDLENQLGDAKHKLSTLNTDKEETRIAMLTIEASVPDNLETIDRSLDLDSCELNKLIDELTANISKADTRRQELLDQLQSVNIEKGVTSTKMKEVKRDKPDGFAIKNKEEAKAYISTKQELMRQIVSDGTDAKNKLSELKTDRERKKIRIESLKEDLDNSGKNDSLKNILDDYNEKLDNYKKELQVINTNLNYNNMAHSCLVSKEGSIKGYILKEIIPFINLEVNNMLELFQINLYVEFNSDFVPDIIRNGKNNAGRISAGQKKMLDFATILAIIKIIKLKYNNVNMIFYDEIFSSIDAINRVVILETLRKLTNELNMNIIVVNHSTLPTSYFDDIMSIESDGVYSTLLCEPAQTFQQ